MSVIINGSAGVTTNTGAVYDSLQRGTAVTASGTSIDFTSIPSWVRRITVMFSGVSTNAVGSAVYMVQLGDSGGIENTGYVGAASTFSSVVATSNYTTGFWLLGSAPIASTSVNGSIVLTNVNGNTWSASGVLGLDNSAATFITGGVKTLSTTLDRVRITTFNGTDIFDAGTINIIYE